MSLTACGPSSQCGYKEVCVQGVCRQACSTNQDDCPYPLTCLAGGVCGEACIAETDCLYGTVCHNNKCEVKVIVRWVKRPLLNMPVPLRNIDIIFISSVRFKRKLKWNLGISAD